MTTPEHPPEEPVVVEVDDTDDPGSLLLPDLDDGVPEDDDAEAPDAGPGEHAAGTDLGGAA